MRKRVLMSALLVMLLLPLGLFARTSGNAKVSFEGPFLLTSGGQGPGSKMLRLLIFKDGTFQYEDQFFLEDEPEPRMVEINTNKYKTLVIVIGCTEKGLGASGENFVEELENLKALIDVAKGKGMSIIAMSLESDKRQSNNPEDENERVIDLVCPEADWILSLKMNNKDKRFTKLSQQYGMPLAFVDSAIEVPELLHRIFVF